METKKEISRELLKIFPRQIRELLTENVKYYSALQEIRIRFGRPISVKISGQEYFLGKNGLTKTKTPDLYIIDNIEIKKIMDNLSQYSLYAYENELCQGFITIDGGHRIGICGQGVIKNGMVTSLNYFSSLNIRIAHEVKGCSDDLIRKLYADGVFENTILISPPGVGKTTLLRDMIRNLSNGYEKVAGKNIGVIDERGELAGLHLGIAQNDLGDKTDILTSIEKNTGISMKIRTMAPEIVAVDEIGREEDIKCINYGISCGTGFLCTAHGKELSDFSFRSGIDMKSLKRIFKNIMILQKDEEKYVKYQVYRGDELYYTN